jgi:CheY-like chemotaxis protein
MVKQCGGNIWVYSEVGQGSSFKVYLPQAHEPAEKRDSQSQTSPDVRGLETVLLVEDEDTVRELVRRVLESNGYTILEASDGRNAEEIADRYLGRVDLLLTDVVMPNMSGHELAGRLKSSRPQMKVMYLSGYTGNSISHLSELGPDAHFLQKPFTPSALARKLREVLES